MQWWWFCYNLCWSILRRQQQAKYPIQWTFGQTLTDPLSGLWQHTGSKWSQSRQMKVYVISSAFKQISLGFKVCLVSIQDPILQKHLLKSLTMSILFQRYATTTKHLTADNDYCCRLVGSLSIMLLMMTTFSSILNGCYDIGILTSYARKTMSGTDHYLASLYLSLRSWYLDAFLIS